ncbi:MAG: hypothetical protein AAGD00_01615 [Planctomycetota bacterium]
MTELRSGLTFTRAHRRVVRFYVGCVVLMFVGGLTAFSALVVGCAMFLVGLLPAAFVCIATWKNPLWLIHGIGALKRDWVPVWGGSIDRLEHARKNRLQEHWHSYAYFPLCIASICLLLFGRLLSPQVGSFGTWVFAVAAFCTLTLIGLTQLARATWRLRVEQEAVRHGLHGCTKCGYELSGLNDIGMCPECGTPFNKVEVRHRVGLWAQPLSIADGNDHS